MSFQPFVSGSGLAGWALLKSTLSAQKSAFNRNPQTLSNSRYFLQKFDTVNSAEDLVENRRLLRVVLGAYGLSEDINIPQLRQNPKFVVFDDPEVVGHLIAE